MPWSENARIAARLREAGERLHERGGNAFSAAAYGHAAEVVEHWREPLRGLHEHGGPGALQELPGVGRGIAAAIAEMLASGRWRALERMREEDCTEESILCPGADGIEHECIVLRPSRKHALHGRDAIARLLEMDGNRGRTSR